MTTVAQDTLAVGRTNEAGRLAWVRAALAALPPGWRLLDAGAGEQRFRGDCAHLRYVSQDFAQYDPARDATGLQMPSWNYGQLDHVCDIAHIPEPDGTFDAILCTEVFEHLPNPLLALAEFARLLRPGGVALITAPFASLTHFAPHHYASGLSRYWYEKHLPAHGFEVVEITPNGNWFEWLAQEIRRISEISGRYADLRPAPGEKEALKHALGFLQRCSSADHGSAELLCYGYHVRAVRR